MFEINDNFNKRGMDIPRVNFYHLIDSGPGFSSAAKTRQKNKLFLSFSWKLRAGENQSSLENTMKLIW